LRLTTSIFLLRFRGRGRREFNTALLSADKPLRCSRQVGEVSFAEIGDVDWPRHIGDFGPP
jgi:hypothetical protein